VNCHQVSGAIVLLMSAGCGQALPWEPQAVAPPTPIVQPFESIVSAPARPQPVPDVSAEPKLIAPPPAKRLPTIVVGDNFAKWMNFRGQMGVAFLCKIRVSSNPDQLPIVAEVHAGNGETRPVELIAKGGDEAIIEYFIPQAGPAGRPYAVQFYVVTGSESREPLGQQRELQWLVAR